MPDGLASVDSLTERRRDRSSESRQRMLLQPLQEQTLQLLREFHSPVGK